MSLLPILAIFVGAGLGALLRWGLGVWLNPVWPSMPLGTVAANLIGGFLVGVAVAVFGQLSDALVEWRLFVITGFLGGLTTFSTFSAEVLAMINRHEFAWALGTAATHLLGSLLLTALGMAFAQVLWLRA